ncbi:hypothetical protein [Methylibium sp.]|uniref:hypothetical protein n=1 Tax=Methylibium sp. TaxID=2067992 RepID=UPI003D11D092
MKTVEAWFWRVPNSLNPKHTDLTEHRLSEEDILKQWPSVARAGGYAPRNVPADTSDESAKAGTL